MAVRSLYLPTPIPLCPNSEILMLSIENQCILALEVLTRLNTGILLDSAADPDMPNLKPKPSVC